MMKTHRVVIPQDPKARRIAEYVVKQRDEARLGDSVMVPAYMAADLLNLLAAAEVPPCPAGCSCRWLEDPDRNDCACDGLCTTDEWDTDRPDLEVR